MKIVCALAGVVLSSAALMTAAAAQGYYGGGPPGYEEDGYARRGNGFDEQEYLRCNGDVLRAIRRGRIESGYAHYMRYGRYERRRLSC